MHCEAVDTKGDRQFGIAQWQSGQDKQLIVARADKAKYRAKANGRNRVEIEPIIKDSVSKRHSGPMAALTAEFDEAEEVPCPSQRHALYGDRIFQQAH